MKNNRQTFELNTVIFVSGDDEVLVKGSFSQGHMSYDTDIIVSHTQLNMVLNQVIQNNPSFSTSTSFEIREINENDTLYYADFSSLGNQMIDLAIIENSGDFRQIRA